MAKMTATVDGGMVSLPDGSWINLLSIQEALNAAFQETGEMKFADAANELSRLTLKHLGPHGEFLEGSYYDSCKGESDEGPPAACLPTVVVEMDGSAIHCVRSSSPVEVIILDADIEGGDEENIHEVDGEDRYVHHYRLADLAEDGGIGIDGDFVKSVVEQIHA